MSGLTNEAEATLVSRVASSFFIGVLSLAAGACAMLAVLFTLDAAEDLSFSADGPGLTFDEAFNVEVGVYLVQSFAHAGLAAFHPETLTEIYGHPRYNPDHPPLGRIGLGLFEALFRPADAEHEGQRAYVISSARTGAAAAFGLLVMLVTWWTSRFASPLAGLFAGLSLLLMPRLFAHAHLATLETFTCLAYAAVVFVLAGQWGHRDRPRWSDGLLPGLLLGLAFLTKMHAVFLPPAIAVWGVWNWRLRSLLPLTVLFATAFVVFFLGWPWLWIDPVNHLAEYFGRAADRAVVHCYYLGERYADRDVPWHYPFVMFAVTTPVPFLLCGAAGIVFGPSRRDGGTGGRGEEGKRGRGEEGTGRKPADGIGGNRAGQLVSTSMVFPLIVFAVPGITVYDGVRLFLMVWPLFAVWVGIGMARLVETVSGRNTSDDAHPVRGRIPRLRLRTLAAAVAPIVMFGFPLWSIVALHPCQLSYYSGVVGGLRGAAALGLERTYWGDAVTPEFLRACSEHLPPGAVLEVAPVLHPLQLEFMRNNSWLRHRPDIELRAYDDQREDLSRYVLVIRRDADPWESLSPPPPGTEVLAQVRRQGVILTELLLLPAGNHAPGE
jgi:hypothetical protein